MEHHRSWHHPHIPSGCRPGLNQITAKWSIRLAQIAAEREEAMRENVLGRLVAAQNAAEVWVSLDLSRKHAVIRTLMIIMA